MLIFLFKSMVCLSLLFGLYKLALGRTTFFRANHFTLITITLLSILIPFVQIPAEQEVSAVGYVDEIVQLANFDFESEPASKSNLFTWQNTLTLIYILGVMSLLLGIIVSAVKNLRFINRTPVFLKEKDYTLLLTDDETVSPYSLGRYVIVSRADYETNGKAILAHETCHVRHNHTLSVMLMNLLSAVLWINPIIWIVREELLLVCEYEADTAVISKGIDAKQYQLLLIKKAVSPSRYTIANSLNHSPLKKRITMMRKSKSNPWACLNYCSLALAAAITLPAFAHKDLISPIEETLKENLVEAISQTAVVEELKSEIAAVTASGEDILDEIGGKGTENPATEQIAEQETAEITPKDTLKATMSATGVFEPTSATGIFEFRSPSDKKPLVLLDGKEVNVENVNKEDIASIKVVKDAEELKPYGEKGKNGVILITSRKSDEAYSSVEEMPKFLDGKIMMHIAQNMKYPEKAVKEKREGRVIVQFVVTKTGAVENVKVVRGVMEELDAEAIRVVQNTSGRWQPGKNKDGEVVNCKYTLPISFKLTGNGLEETAVRHPVLLFHN